MITGELDQAEKILNEGLQFNPKEGILNHYVVQLAVMRRNYEKALSGYEKLIQTEPKENLTGMRAEIYAIHGDREQALKLDKRSYIYLLLEMYKEGMVELKKVSSKLSYLRLLHSRMYNPLRSDPEFIQLMKERKADYDELLLKYANDPP